MARYTEALCRLCRRESEKLFLKGDRCYTDKCAVERRKYPPGQHGQRRKKFSDYALQLREKQKAKETYGVLERQFKKFWFGPCFPRKGLWRSRFQSHTSVYLLETGYLSRIF